MSLYNMLFGHNRHAPVVLALLDITPNDVPRFRDAYFSLYEDRAVLVLHTRTGGGNREWYDEENAEAIASGYTGPWNADLRKLPSYITDSDAEHDATYANFYFEAPERVRAALTEALALNGVETPEEKWTRLLEGLRAGKHDPARPAGTAPAPVRTDDPDILALVVVAPPDPPHSAATAQDGPVAETVAADAPKAAEPPAYETGGAVVDAGGFTTGGASDSGGEFTTGGEI